MTQNRKIRQIEVTQSDRFGDRLYVLCDDGTIWYQDPADHKFKWHRINIHEIEMRDRTP